MVADWLLQVGIAVRIRYCTRGGYLLILIEEDFRTPDVVTQFQ
jgi:hypothetical protein